MKVDGPTVEALEAVRDAVAADLLVCDSMRDRAALYLRLTDVLVRLDELRPSKAEVDAVDEIAQRRSARRSARAKGSSSAKRSG